MTPAHKPSPRRRAAAALGCAAAGAYGASLLSAAGPGHWWSVGHGWLAGGGVDRVAAAAAVALGASGLLLARARTPDDAPLALDGKADDARQGAPTRRKGFDPHGPGPMSPREFVARNGRDPYDMGAKVDAGLLREAFAAQLGRRVTPGLPDPGDHVRWVVALAAAHACPGLMPARAADLRRDVAMTWLRPRPGHGATMRLVDEVLARASDWVTPRVAAHAYANVLLLRVVGDAVAEGAFPMGDLSWLKDLDRTAWYAVNAAGRPTCLVEAAGVVAHLNAERKAGRPLPEPRIDKAMAALSRHVARANQAMG